MAEEIIQRMGFDTGDSVSQLDALKAALENVNTSIGTVAASLKAFNSSGSGMNQAMSDLTSKVDAILAKFNSLGTTQAPSLKVDTSAALKQIRELTAEWGRAPKGQASMDLSAAKASLAGFVASSKASAAEVNAAFANMGKGGTSALQVEVDKLGQTFKTLVPPTKEASNALSGYFSTLAKVTAMRAGIAAFQELSQGIADGTKAAQDFSVKLAQTAGILDDTSMSMTEIGTAVKATSEAFARPLGETNQAFYQTMQNQIGGATESMYLFTEAAKLATANQIPLNDAVNLLTSSIKGWGDSTYQAGHQSSMFFEAIKIGRFEASDLSDVLGRIGPSAKEMGVGLEEAMAGVAIMTQQGTLASTAITQMAAGMTALAKPSAALKKIMTDVWGVKNAEEAIAKFGGIRQVFAQIEQISGGTSDELNQLIKNIRGMRMEMGLAGENSKAWAEATERLKNPMRDVSEASNLVLNSAGGQAQKATNDLALAWENFGEKLLPVKTLFISLAKYIVEFASSTAGTFIGMGVGIGGVALGISSIIPMLIKATTATYAFVAAWALTPWGAAALLGTAAGLVAAGIYEYVAAIHDAEAASKRLADTVKKETAEETKAQIEELSKQTRAQKEFIDQKISGMVQVFSQAKTLMAKETQEVYFNNDAMVTAAKGRFNRVLNAQQAYVDALVNAESVAAQKIMGLQSEIAGMEQTLADKRFDLNNRQQNWLQQNINNTQRMNDLLRDAAKATQSAQTPEELKQAELFLKRADDYRQKALAGAHDLGGINSESYALQQKELVIEQAKIDIKKRARDLAEQDAKLAKALQPEAQTNMEKLREYVKQYEALIDLRKQDQNKTPKTSQEAEADLAKAKEVFSKIEEIKNTTGNISDILEIGKLGSNVKAQLDALGPLNRELMLNVKINQATLEAAFNSLSEKQKQLFGDGNKFDVFGGFEGKSVKLGNDLKAVTDQLQTVNSTSLTLHNTLMGLFGTSLQGEDLIKVVNQLDSSRVGGKQLANDIIATTDAFRALANEKPGTAAWHVAFATATEELAKLRKDYEGISGWAKPSINAIFDKNMLIPFDTMVKETQKVIADIGNKPVELKIKKDELEAQLKSVRNVAAEIQGPIDGVLQGVQAWTPPINNVTTSAIPAMNNALLTVPAAIAPGITAMENLAAAAWEAARAAAAASSAGGGGGETSQAFGGVIRRAQGGFVPSWKDTVPAMLQPKEFIVKAAAARRFFPQLQAMNAGVVPSFKAQGGPVTNVGDISVNVTGGNTAAQTIREIGVGLRRGIKQGTIKLN